jgi:hypothetical protein
MNNDRDMKNVTDQNRHQQQGGAPTMQRSKAERGDISNEIKNEEIDDDVMTDQGSRSDLGAGE